jgi:hypothetical protein
LYFQLRGFSVTGVQRKSFPTQIRRMVPSYFLYDSNKPGHFRGSELGEWSRVLADTDAERQSTRERAMGNQFLEMPVHCQKAAAMQASFSIDSAFGFSLSEKSPNKTSQPPEGTRHGSGSLETGHSPSDTLLAITANATHHQVGKKVRQTIKELGGTMPENLPTADSIKKVDATNKPKAIRGKKS